MLDALLKQPVDFAREGMAPFYLDFWEKMKAAFPDESVGFSFGLEGPITTAYELRGEAFFTDLFDSPDLLPEFLELMTRSIVDYHRFCSRLTGAESVDPRGAGLVDDIASFVPPRLFPRYVMPYWEQYYAGVTTGRRNAHVEDLKRAQLGFLEDIGLSYYDPSISHKLNPRTIAEEIRVPFGWRLGSFHYSGMDEQDVRDFVFQAAADGASQVFTIIEATLSDEEGVRKVTAFKQAGEEVERLLGQGCSRAELGGCVSARGRARFWECWPE